MWQPPASRKSFCSVRASKAVRSHGFDQVKFYAVSDYGKNGQLTLCEFGLFSHLIIASDDQQPVLLIHRGQAERVDVIKRIVVFPAFGDKTP